MPEKESAGNGKPHNQAPRHNTPNENNAWPPGKQAHYIEYNCHKFGAFTPADCFYLPCVKLMCYFLKTAKNCCRQAPAAFFSARARRRKNAGVLRKNLGGSLRPRTAAANSGEAGAGAKTPRNPIPPCVKLVCYFFLAEYFLITTFAKPVRYL